jgi:hypothetical protein
MAPVRAVIPPLVGVSWNKELSTEMTKLSDRAGSEGPPLLHGEDLPKGTDKITVTCKELRVAPDNFSSPMIMDFTKPVEGKEGWALNKTNVRNLYEKFGLDSEDVELEDLAKKCAGKKFTLSVMLVNNPKTKKMVRSLFLI